MLVKGMILDSFESSMIAIESDTANIIVSLFLDIVQLYGSQ